MGEKKKAKRLVSVRLEEELVAEIERLAGIQNRNFSNMVETILKEQVGPIK